MNIPSSKYDSNITAGGLLYNEFLTIEPIIHSDDFESLLRHEIEENKFIGINTRSARQRIIPQVIKRVFAVPSNFWDFFYGLNAIEKKQALFFVVLKTYPLLFDLHFEVGVKKFKTGGTLSNYDVQMRLDEIASTDDYVASWSNSTFKKINSRYLKILEDVNLYKNGSLQRSNILTKSYWDFYRKNGEQWFLKACFIEN